MARMLSSQTEIEQRLTELLRRRADSSDYEALLAELRERVKQYEARFGMSSDRIHDAIEAGELIEDLEVVDWIFTLDLLRNVEEK